MVLGFMEQMEHPILADTKIHTCRDTKNNFRPGMFMDFVIGNRTPGRRIFAQKICTCVQSVDISYEGRLVVFVGGLLLNPEETKLFIVNDGFESDIDCVNYFCVKLTHGGLGFNSVKFSGKLIQWTDFRYHKDSKFINYGSDFTNPVD